MDGIGELFGVWLAIMASRAGTPVALNPPAEPGAMERVESDLPRELPDELRELYRVADGQKSSWVPWKRSARSPLFEDKYRFLSLEDALGERQRQLDARSGQREDSHVRPFEPDWFPFAADGDGNGLAVDLVTDDRGPRGMIKRYRVADWNDPDLGPSLDGYLRRGIEIADSLSLHHPSDDPLRVHLRRWYHERAGTPSAAVEESLEDMLRYWLGSRWGVGGGSIVPDYHWAVAWHMDERIACGADMEAVSEGVRLANDWCSTAT